MLQIDTEMLGVARLRTAGKTWEECAEVVPKAAETMRHWQYKRAEEWRVALVTAIDEALGTYENEALLVCRQHLRDPDKAATAARDLLRHCRELRGTRMKLEHSGPEGGPLEVFLKMPDEELDEIADTSTE